MLDIKVNTLRRLETQTSSVTTAQSWNKKEQNSKITNFF